MYNYIYWCIFSERDESDEEHMSDDDSDEEDSDIPYNPKNLPLGWDGKVNKSAFCSSLNVVKVFFRC